MDNWKRGFLDKLNQAQAQWTNQVEDAVDSHFVPVFEDYQEFLSPNGFCLSKPLREAGRRSFKFELAENAFLLMLFRSTAVGELELQCESFVPGREPVSTKFIARAADLTADWATRRVQAALDTFVELLAGQTPEPAAELIEV